MRVNSDGSTGLKLSNGKFCQRVVVLSDAEITLAALEVGDDIFLEFVKFDKHNNLQSAAISGATAINLLKAPMRIRCVDNVL